MTKFKRENTHNGMAVIVKINMKSSRHIFSADYDDENPWTGSQQLILLK